MSFTESDIHFEILLSFIMGLLAGGVSYNILVTFIMIFIYEFFMVHVTKYFNKDTKMVNRFISRVFYFGGWIIGRILMLNETGLEVIELI